MFLLGLWWPNVDPPKCNGSDKRWWRHNHSSSWHKGWLLTNLWRQEEARVCWAVPNLAAESFTHIVCSGQHQKPLLKMKTCPKRPRPPKTLYRSIESCNLAASWDCHQMQLLRALCSSSLPQLPRRTKEFQLLRVVHFPQRCGGPTASPVVTSKWPSVGERLHEFPDRSWQVLTGLDSDTTKLLTW